MNTDNPADVLTWAQRSVLLQEQPLVILAASAGGLKAIKGVLSRLPADFPAAIAIVQHRGDHDPNLLCQLLRSHTELTVRNAEDGDCIQPGNVYLCPPGVHMSVQRSLRIIHGPKLNFVRPSADLMLESAAEAYGDEAVAVVLSGNGVDSARGCQAILAAGGKVIAQDPKSADYAGMPMAAIAIGKTEEVLPLAQIGAALQQTFAERRRVSGKSSDALSDSITVLLADDHRIIRDGLRALLLGKGGFSVVAEAENGTEAVDLAAEYCPQVVVMDVAMPDLNGIEATRQILQHNPLAKVLALSSDETAQSASATLRAGAVGYLTKNSAFEELAKAIQTVVSGKMYLSSDIASAFVNQYIRETEEEI